MGPGHDSSPILRIEALRKSFASGPGRIQVLRGCDLAVPPGRIVAVVGASGAGKSTLLHLVGGLDRPDSGRIYYGGVEVARAGEEDRARLRMRHIGFIFQQHYLLRDFTALENVVVPQILAGADPGAARARALALLDQMGLIGRAGHYPSQLSGGEQQRVALARALANDPALVLADEPTGNLDRATGEALYMLLYSVARKGHQSWVVATHNEYLARLADTRYRLEDGVLRPIEDGRPAGGSAASEGAQP
jgi:lipoprotein-releasing system ATP-binding protein